MGLSTRQTLIAVLAASSDAQVDSYYKLLRHAFPENFEAAALPDQTPSDAYREADDVLIGFLSGGDDSSLQVKQEREVTAHSGFTTKPPLE
ncbi:MAG: hypothetical protein SF162_20375 [bacterium]|nr:hypothetical protein [bacterium]